MCTGLRFDPTSLRLLASARSRLPSAHADRIAAAGEAQAGETPDLTPETVNAALDEVRPYLIADGGNVEVASVEEGVVFLRLQASYPHPRLIGTRVPERCLTAQSVRGLLPCRHPQPRLLGRRMVKRCLRAWSASDLLPCLHGPLLLQLSLSGCSASRRCCSQKHVACCLFAARRCPVHCHASVPQAACASAGRLRDLPLLGRHHEDGH